MECFRILNDGLPLGCTLNPVLGREFEYGDEKLVKNGGAILKGRKLTAVEDGAVTIADAKTGDETSLPADLVVLAMGVRPDRPDYEALREAYGDKLILVGDSCRPGQIYDALHSGHDKAFVY